MDASLGKDNPGLPEKLRVACTIGEHDLLTGIVLCPAGLESLIPANQGDLDFDAFAKICHSTSLYLYISQRQFADEELDQLEIFSNALRSLQAEVFENARHGVVERDCGVFARWLNPNPPPYPEECVSEQGDPPVYCKHFEQVIGKRRTVPWSKSPDDKTRKRQVLTSPERLGPTSPEALGSPTEANTPSTCSSSPSSIRPTDFTLTSPPGHIKRNKLAHLVHALRGVSDEEIRKVLIQSGRRHLLAIEESDLPSESEKVRFANVEMVERRLEQYVNDEIERRLKRYVNDEIVDRAVNECYDQILDQHRTNAADVDEQVEDGKAEVCNAANDYMKDLEEEVQKHKDKIEEQAQQCLNDIENRAIEVEMSAQEEIAKLKRWFKASAQLDRKSSTSHELGTRRVSI
ncbi:hypothetical protein N7519_001239 [Penicillium mononematosum]|uniref:uncharacterized protein n=1 Tax=Penicillium mononematosum TaxID=268346 RepID=UPI0025492E2C|nr:uncharacterized protein N7519_001239 [Penicillium mononematosum]KAJ6191218.1 hypothetical protein N7519_001239 [Penicillium mononematosum]